MSRFLRFLGIGSAFSTVEEVLTVLVLRGDLGAYLFTLFILFPAFLTFVWISRRLLTRFVRLQPVRDLIHYLLYGLVGLLIEWFAIGLSPWSDPDANPILMVVFQAGMFSFWATVAFAPLLFVNPDPLSRQARGWVLHFYIPYFVLTYVAALLSPSSLKFVVIVGLIVLGHLALNVFYVRYFLASFKRAGQNSRRGRNALNLTPYASKNEPNPRENRRVVL